MTPPATAGAAPTRCSGSAGYSRCAAERHTDPSWTRLLTGLDTGDTDDEQLARTWIAAQDLRLIYHSPDRARAEQSLYH